MQTTINPKPIKIKKYSAEEKEWLAQNASSDTTTIELTRRFNDQFSADRKTAHIRRYLKSHNLPYKTHRISSHNFHKHYVETGEQHPRWKPIGTIRECRDGREIKFQEIVGAKHGRINWKPLSRFIYEQAYGEITDKDAIVFRIDGNKFNDNLENLILIHRRDIGAVNNALTGKETASIEERKAIILMIAINQLAMAKTGEKTGSMKYAEKMKMKMRRNQIKEGINHD